MTNDTIAGFWIQAQILVLELSKKAKEHPLTESEAMMHASVCRGIEEYFRIQQVLLEIELHGLRDKFNKLLKQEEEQNGSKEPM